MAYVVLVVAEGPMKGIMMDVDKLLFVNFETFGVAIKKYLTWHP